MKSLIKLLPLLILLSCLPKQYYKFQTVYSPELLKGEVTAQDSIVLESKITSSKLLKYDQQKLDSIIKDYNGTASYDVGIVRISLKADTSENQLEDKSRQLQDTLSKVTFQDQKTVENSSEKIKFINPAIIPILVFILSFSFSFALIKLFSFTSVLILISFFRDTYLSKFTDYPKSRKRTLRRITQLTLSFLLGLFILLSIIMAL